MANESDKLRLPDTAPDIVSGDDVHGSEFLPFALYSLVQTPEAALQDLADELEREQVIHTDNGQIHLVRLAKESHRQQTSLGDVLSTHIEDAKANKNELQYFPFGFLAVHEADWKTKGLFLVYVDFEEPFPVVGFRIRARHVGEACRTLRDDDNGYEQVRDMYQID